MGIPGGALVSPAFRSCDLERHHRNRLCEADHAPPPGPSHLSLPRDELCPKETGVCGVRGEKDSSLPPHLDPLPQSHIS
jgi:hypothetical protein